MESPQQMAIGHLQDRLGKAFARLDFQILLTPFQNHVRQVQLLWGFHIKIMGVQKLRGVWKRAVGVLLFCWGIGGGMEIVVGFFSVGSVGGAVVSEF